MPLIGYARISTEDQTALPQVLELRSAGCVEIVEEQASGGSRSRPVLARALDQLRVGDTLVVVRIDRLALVQSRLKPQSLMIGVGPRGPTRPVSPGSPDGSARWTTGCAEAQMDGGTGSR